MNSRMSIVPLATVTWAVVVALAGCASQTAGPAEPPAPAAAPAPAPAPVAPPPAAPAPAPLPPPTTFSEAVSRAGEKMFADLRARLGEERRTLVIDPLIDASTGQQTVGSVQMGEQLAGIVRAKYPMWSVQPLTRTALNDKPLLLVGTLTAIHTRNVQTEPADAFRICLRVVDLRTGEVIGRGLDRATVDSVNAEPTPYFRDSPTWHKDKTTTGYITTCQGTQLGSRIDPTYLMRLPAAAVLNEALMAYTGGQLRDAYRLYREAAVLAEPDDLRVLNGQYLTAWRLGRRAEAREVFDRIVQAGFETQRLPLKLLFAPGSTQLLSTGDLRAQYQLWLERVARGAVAAEESCLRVVGHASKTGTAEVNDVLSERRANFVRQRLVQQAPKAAPRLTAIGMGSRETLIGLGTDDLRDVLDRRVEFRVVGCS